LADRNPAGPQVITTDDVPLQPPRHWIRPLLLIVFLAVIVLAYARWREELSLDRLVTREQQLRDALDHHWLWTVAGAFAVYVLVTSTFVGSATVVSLVYGWLFGFLPGTLLVSFASTTAATLTFLASRYLFRAQIERRFAAQFRRVDKAWRDNGVAFLLSLRLIPGIPFMLLNAVIGLTPIRWTSYWWVSQLGMLPATLVIVYAGSTVPDLATLRARGVSNILSPQFIVALLLLGLFPLVVAFLRRQKWLVA
jgi:uncharacterized membrane protein YdjX (TVP38/TMEM64 family)